MKNFNYSTFTKVKSIGITVFFIILMFVFLVLMSFSEMPYKGIYIILGILTGIVVAKYEGSSHRNSKITIDNEKIHIYRNKANIITDRTLRYEEILAIKLVTKKDIFSLNITKILLVTELLTIDIDINCYDNYKVLLNFIIDKVKTSEKVVIDEGVLDLI